MAIRDVVTLGFGNGTYDPGVNKLPTLGYASLLIVASATILSPDYILQGPATSRHTLDGPQTTRLDLDGPATAHHRLEGPQTAHHDISGPRSSPHDLEGTT